MSNKTVPLIHELRNSGWAAKVIHHRWFYIYNTKGVRTRKLLPYVSDTLIEYADWFMEANGGMTETFLTDPEGYNYYGSSHCSVSDQYVKKIGVKKATARALATAVAS